MCECESCKEVSEAVEAMRVTIEQSVLDSNGRHGVVCKKIDCVTKDVGDLAVEIRGGPDEKGYEQSHRHRIRSLEANQADNAKRQIRFRKFGSSVLLTCIGLLVAAVIRGFFKILDAIGM